MTPSSAPARLTAIVRLACGLLLPASLATQSITPKEILVESTSPPRIPARAVVLAAFVVNTAKVDGFSATHAGTATKLGLDRKEIAAPYSIITGEFLSFLSITNVQGAIRWSTNGSPYHRRPGRRPVPRPRRG